ncbi:E3 ubiquitin-protein ligase UBR4-domain-containing protein [Scenedesmus sp. NREL 46B-D3]|nr:E3 ubiquitin-protein ligase UBR4-domain-containing protein [Scenedesmus sp. NREL 46B-D3]
MAEEERSRVLSQLAAAVRQAGGRSTSDAGVLQALKQAVESVTAAPGQADEAVAVEARAWMPWQQPLLDRQQQQALVTVLIVQQQLVGTPDDGASVQQAAHSPQAGGALGGLLSCALEEAVQKLQLAGAAAGGLPGVLRQQLPGCCAELELLGQVVQVKMLQPVGKQNQLKLLAAAAASQRQPAAGSQAAAAEEPVPVQKPPPGRQQPAAASVYLGDVLLLELKWPLLVQQLKQHHTAQLEAAGAAAAADGAASSLAAALPDAVHSLVVEAAAALHTATGAVNAQGSAAVAAGLLVCLLAAGSRVQCSYAAHGDNFVEQHWYQCYTCGLVQAALGGGLVARRAADVAAASSMLAVCRGEWVGVMDGWLLAAELCGKDMFSQGQRLLVAGYQQAQVWAVNPADYTVSDRLPLQLPAAAEAGEAGSVISAAQWLPGSEAWVALTTPCALHLYDLTHSAAQPAVVVRPRGHQLLAGGAAFRPTLQQESGAAAAGLQQVLHCLLLTRDGQLLSAALPPRLLAARQSCSSHWPHIGCRREAAAAGSGTSASGSAGQQNPGAGSRTASPGPPSGSPAGHQQRGAPAGVQHAEQGRTVAAAAAAAASVSLQSRSPGLTACLPLALSPAALFWDVPLLPAARRQYGSPQLLVVAPGQAKQPPSGSTSGSTAAQGTGCAYVAAIAPPQGDTAAPALGSSSGGAGWHVTTQPLHLRHSAGDARLDGLAVLPFPYTQQLLLVALCSSGNMYMYTSRRPAGSPPLQPHTQLLRRRTLQAEDSSRGASSSDGSPEAAARALLRTLADPERRLEAPTASSGMKLTVKFAAGSGLVPAALRFLLPGGGSAPTSVTISAAAGSSGAAGASGLGAAAGGGGSRSASAAAAAAAPAAAPNFSRLVQLAAASAGADAASSSGHSQRWYQVVLTPAESLAVLAAAGTASTAAAAATAGATAAAGSNGAGQLVLEFAAAVDPSRRAAVCHMDVWGQHEEAVRQRAAAEQQQTDDEALPLELAALAQAACSLGAPALPAAAAGAGEDASTAASLSHVLLHSLVQVGAAAAVAAPGISSEVQGSVLPAVQALLCPDVPSAASQAIAAGQGAEQQQQRLQAWCGALSGIVDIKALKPVKALAKAVLTELAGGDGAAGRLAPRVPAVAAHPQPPQAKCVAGLRLWYCDAPLTELRQLKPGSSSSSTADPAAAGLLSSSQGDRPAWKLAAADVALAPGQADVAVEFELPLLCNALMLELTGWHVSVNEAAAEVLHCPRCSHVVTDKHGMCSYCRENAYQCRQCRHINYEAPDAFICPECGHSSGLPAPHRGAALEPALGALDAAAEAAGSAAAALRSAAAAVVHQAAALAAAPYSAPALHKSAAGGSSSSGTGKAGSSGTRGSRAAGGSAAAAAGGPGAAGAAAPLQGLRPGLRQLCTLYVSRCRPAFEEALRTARLLTGLAQLQQGSDARAASSPGGSGPWVSHACLCGLLWAAAGLDALAPCRTAASRAAAEALQRLLRQGWLEGGGGSGKAQGVMCVSAALVSLLAAAVTPETPRPNYQLLLEKAATQEEFIPGQLPAGGLVTASALAAAAGGGGGGAAVVLMRDVKNYICARLDMAGLLGDDFGMELLVGNSIVALSLPVDDVVERHWWPRQQQRTSGSSGPAAAAAAGPPAGVAMPVTFRLSGLDGEATEPLVKDLNPAQGGDQGTEQEQGLAAVLSQQAGRGLGVLLQLLLLAQQQPLRALRWCRGEVLQLLRAAVRLEPCRVQLLRMGALGTLLHLVHLSCKPLLAAAAADRATSGRQGAAGAAAAAVGGLGGGMGVAQLADGLSVLEVAGLGDCAAVLARLLTSLAQHSSTAQLGLLQHFAPALDLNALDAACGSGGDAAAGSSAGGSDAATPDPGSEGDGEPEGDADGAAAAAAALAADAPQLLRLLHVLEGTAGGSTLTPLAEACLEAAAGSGDAGVAATVDALRAATAAEMRARAAKKREALLASLGMVQVEAGVEAGGGFRILPSPGGVPALSPLAAELAALESSVDAEEAAGGACMVCREGYCLQPGALLGCYCYCRVAAAAEWPGCSPPWGTPYDLLFTSVSHFNLIHVDCHAAAKAADASLRQPKREWQGATLRNGSVLCNALLPLAAPAAGPADTPYAAAVAAFWQQQLAAPSAAEAAAAAGGSGGGRSSAAGDAAAAAAAVTASPSRRAAAFREADSSLLRVSLVAADVATLLRRFAYSLSFSEEARGGGRASNARLLLALLQLGRYFVVEAAADELAEVQQLLAAAGRAAAALGLEAPTPAPAAPAAAGSGVDASVEAAGAGSTAAGDAAAAAGGVAGCSREELSELAGSAAFVLALSLLVSGPAEWMAARRSLLALAVRHGVARWLDQWAKPAVCGSGSGWSAAMAGRLRDLPCCGQAAGELVELVHEGEGSLGLQDLVDGQGLLGLVLGAAGVHCCEGFVTRACAQP